MINQIVAGLMLAEGIVFGVIAFVLVRKKQAKLAVWRRTWGDVIDVKERGGGEGATRHPVIRYKASNSQEVIFESKFGSSNWGVKPGDRLEILFNPGNPSEAEVVNSMAQWGLPVIFAVVAAGSILGAPVVYFLLRL